MNVAELDELTNDQIKLEERKDNEEAITESQHHNGVKHMKENGVQTQESDRHK